MSILDYAEDYVQRKQHINRLERPGDDLPNLDELTRAIKEHLAVGSDLTVERINPNTGEIVNALELPELNVRLFLRDSPATFVKCVNCGAQIQTRSKSEALARESIIDIAAEARKDQWRAPDPAWTGEP